MDVKIAFLNSDLGEDVYVTQLEGFESIDSQKVCKLQRSILDLRRPLEVGTSILMKRSKYLISSKMRMIHVCIRRLVGV